MENNQKFRVLVTGGSGFVGANLVRALIKSGHEVHCFLRPGYQKWRLEEVKTQYVSHMVDLADHMGIKSMVKTIQPHWVFHCAAYGAYPSQNNWDSAFQTNVLDTLNLIQSCASDELQSFVYTGSSSEYGHKDHAPKEIESVEPEGAYGITKAMATLMLSALARTQALPISILRLYSVYGPFEEESRLMPTILHHLQQKRWPPMAEGGTSRDFIYIDDVIEAMILVAQQQERLNCGSIFNLGTGKQTNLFELVRILQQLFNIDSDPIFSAENRRVWDYPIWVANSDLIEQTLGWRPKTLLPVGLMLMNQWLLEGQK